MLFEQGATGEESCNRADGDEGDLREEHPRGRQGRQSVAEFRPHRRRLLEIQVPHDPDGQESSEQVLGEQHVCRQIPLPVFKLPDSQAQLGEDPRQDPGEAHHPDVPLEHEERARQDGGDENRTVDGRLCHEHAEHRRGDKGDERRHHEVEGRYGHADRT